MYWLFANLKKVINPFFYFINELLGKLRASIVR